MSIFDKLKKAIVGTSPVSVFQHPVLGDLTFSLDEDCWLTTFVLNGKSIRILISGDDTPSVALISHAESIVSDFQTIDRKISEFLENEARSFPEALRPEIGGLQLADICLMWPDRPDDGMLYFTGSINERVWRCDYINRKPMGLGYDD